MPLDVARGSVATDLHCAQHGPDGLTRYDAKPVARGAATGSTTMFELYLGLVPGEEPIDRLIDDAMADPTSPGDRPAIDREAIASAAAITCQPLADETAGHGLWHRLRARWTDAPTAGLPPASRSSAFMSSPRRVGGDKKFQASTLG
jgi:hypothetical protein